MGHFFFSEEKVSEIRDRASILEVVSDYVSLKKTGKNYKGLCPFHSEKTPSFTVNEEKQIFHCFGCGAGGNVFAFLMRVGHFSFPQALEELARRYGVSLPPREFSPAREKEAAKRDLLFQINQTASQYFHDLLVRRKEGGEARRYLSQRGMKEETIEQYRLGYSLEIWDGLVQHLREKKLSLELTEELGLVSPKKRGGWYDTFRGRIIFPIFDHHERVVGFGGRAIGKGMPKYLNSPESSIYHKGEILYGLQVAKRYIPEKEYGIIAEGYFDLLTLHQHGLKNSVATLGTALTTHHIRTLKRYTENLINVFDADQAGVQATLRALPLFLEEEVVGKTVILPKGEDPDEFLRKGNLEDFVKRVAEAVPLVDFFFEELMKSYDLNTIEGKVKVAEKGLALLHKIPNRIRMDFYIRMLAERLDLQEEVLYQKLRSFSKDRIHTEGSSKKQGVMLANSFPKSEEMVVRLMLHHPDLIPSISEEEVLRDFESPVLKKMAEDLEALYRKGGRLDIAQALEPFEEEVRKRLWELVFEEDGMEARNQKKVLTDCIEKIRSKRLQKDKKELLKRIKESERQEGGRGLEALLVECQELSKKRGASSEK